MKKKLLIIVNDLSFFISHRLEIALAAKKGGYDVKIAYGEKGDNIKKKKSIIGIKCFYVPIYRSGINPFKELWSIAFLWYTFIRLKPDIVHLITVKAYLYGGIAAILSSVPCVVSAITGFGVLFNNKSWKKRIFCKLLYPIFYLAFNHSNQKIIVQNSNDKLFLEKLGVKKKKIVIFPGSGINLKKFKNFNGKFTNKKIIICFASRLLRDKGLYDFISASKILRNRGIKARFLLAGSLDLKNPTSISRQDLKNIQKEEHLEVLGYIENIPALYAKTHIVCLPSYYGEGIPKSLIEAAAAGRVVVTTNHPGCRDAIIPNKTGLLVPTKNPEKLANALEWLIKHPKKRNLMGRTGRLLAEKKFDINLIIQKHLEIYNLLQKNR